jgi:hypothetical protein
MSFATDLFGGANSAAAQQQQAAQLGIQAAQQGAQNASNDVTNATASAVAPFNQLFPTALSGISSYADALGLNGPAGSQSAKANLVTTPGYQFTLGQGNGAINAAAAANGTLNSGNQLTALSNYDSGLASNTYNNYVSQLAPFLGFGSNIAGNISSAYQNEGTNLAGIQGNETNAITNAVAGYGNAGASASLANQGFAQSLLGGGLNAVTSSGLLNKAVTGLGGLLTPSDERLKEDVEPVGELYDGTNVFRFRYKGDDRTQIGVMAQEVAGKKPSAVADVGGILAVDHKAATDYAAQLARLLKGHENGATPSDGRAHAPAERGYAARLLEAA